MKFFTPPPGPAESPLTASFNARDTALLVSVLWVSITETSPRHRERRQVPSPNLYDLSPKTILAFRSSRSSSHVNSSLISDGMAYLQRSASSGRPCAYLIAPPYSSCPSSRHRRPDLGFFDEEIAGPFSDDLYSPSFFPRPMSFAASRLPTDSLVEPLLKSEVVRGSRRGRKCNFERFGRHRYSLFWVLSPKSLLPTKQAQCFLFLRFKFPRRDACFLIPFFLHEFYPLQDA